MSEPRPPISRKLGVYIAAGTVSLMMFGLLLLIIFKNPSQEREEQRAQEEAEAVEKLPTPDERVAERLLDRLDSAPTEEASEGEPGTQAEDTLSEADVFAQLDTPPPRPEAPLPTNEQFLDLLEEADREAGRPPELPRLSLGSGAGGDAPGISTFEDYPKEDAASSANARNTEPEVYETIAPTVAPGDRVVHRGTPIRAALLSRIDTRNEGPVTAIVTRDVYDSRTQSMLLIPKGSKLMGAYSSDVEPGIDRVATIFESLILPDGRLVKLGGMPSAAPDGAVGVAGEYKPNFWRIIGPTFVLALAGNKIDEEFPSQNQGTFGGTPSVAQQVVPQLNEAVLSRYASAKPYFIADPGTEIRIVVTQEIEIPLAGGGA